MVEGHPRPVSCALQLSNVVREVLVEGRKGLVISRATPFGFVRRQQSIMQLLEALEEVLDKTPERTALEMKVAIKRLLLRPT